MKKFLFQNPKAKKTDESGKLPMPKVIWICLGLNLLNISLVLILKNKLPPEVPLFYGLAEGEEQLTSRFGLITPGVVSLFITIMNVLVALLLQDAFLKKVLIATSLFATILSLTTVIKIILLVSSL